MGTYHGSASRERTTATLQKRDDSMAKLKTTQTSVLPAEFINTIEHKTRRQDATFLLPWLSEVTGFEPVMWGSSIIGYGRYYYRYDTGHEGEYLITGYSPRKANLVFYIMPGYRDLTEPLGRLGKHKLGKSCLYVNKLADIELDVLAEIVTAGVSFIRNNYQTWDK